jgi:acetate kinase
MARDLAGRMKILVLNGGSSSLKAQLREVTGGEKAGPAPAPLWDARADWGRRAGAADIRITSRDYAPIQREIGIRSSADVIAPVLGSLWSGPASVLQHREEIDAVGHRVVHGGKSFRQTVRITPEVQAEILRLAEFAPQHNPFEAEAIEAAEQVLGPRVPHVAVFDTAFHATLPDAAFTYPGPYSWLDLGIKRYGFHGISHQYASRRAAEILNRPVSETNVITCHLGNGCSLAAVRRGVSVDTTMGFTPLDGLMMGTRCGAIDPGIIVYLLRHCGYSADQLDDLLNRRSGLKGISGVSGDMRAIVEAMDRSDQRARLAFDMFVHILCRNIGAMAASLDGVDALVFTAGIGENSAIVRRRTCERLGMFGVRIDDAKNESSRGDADIATVDSRTRVLVVRTEEEWEIARECYRLTAGANA